MFSSLTSTPKAAILVGANGSILNGYNNICVKDIETSVDGTAWALDCDRDINGNYQVLKWDPKNQRWYKVSGIRGVKIGVFNEVSAVVLPKDGRIYFSSEPLID